MIIHKHTTIWQKLRKLLLTIVIMTVVLMLAGVAYVYYSGRQDAAKLANTKDVIEDRPLVPKPVMPGPNAPNGASVQYLASPVKPGENTNINVHTGPYSKCTIVVAYKNIVSKDTGLVPKSADVHGIVEWTWTVDKAAPEGTWPVKVTCDRNGKVGFVQGYLVVAK